ncbi:MAG: xanthine dehydrogenase molybdopterin binding subunit [Acidiferrobacter sp.]|nr:xanthine dehydrogenase molybdopterin binding subunit [Acidiferrobacter sp.]
MSNAANTSPGAPLAHDSALKHTTGKAVYIDDLPLPADTLHLAVGGADTAVGAITAVALDAVRAAPGVIDVFCAADIPGENDVSPSGRGDEPLLASGEIRFDGEPVFAVVAASHRAARAAAALGQVTVRPAEPVLTVDDALSQNRFISDEQVMTRGDWREAMQAAPHTTTGTLYCGGQDHFYLEGQISLAVPQEDGDMLVYCSTQHPSEIQQHLAKVLNQPAHAITVEVRRMGGGFGGKESQACQWAALAAVAASRNRKAVKCRLDRDDDMRLTGKRHDFRIDWQVGHDDQGQILSVDCNLASRCGCALDLSDPVNDRAMFHVDNAYYFPAVNIRSQRTFTNTVSNTAFRGFGGPQGMLAGERIIEGVARATGLDPLTVRKRNFYGGADRNITPYFMQIDDFVLDEIVEELEQSSHYWARRDAIREANAADPLMVRGLALTPVKFGISFTATWFNQAGALLHIYRDGSVHLNHGGTEMGQGLFVKVAQVVSHALALPVDSIKVSATRTDKVPNTSATAASSGADLNAMAALNAANTLKQRLISFAAHHFDVDAQSVQFANGTVIAGDRQLPFAELVELAYLARVQLSAAGFYRTPKIHYNRKKARGRPFYYFAYGAAVSEVIVDTLTGESRVTAVDILHDAGKSLNPAVDLGQVEGAFIQGMGWLTNEELWWDQRGKIKTYAPSTYKIPTCSDRPTKMNIALWSGGENREPTVHRSKAVGEPPLMLAISVHQALSDAVSSISGYRFVPELNAPATPEALMHAIVHERQRAAASIS